MKGGFKMGVGHPDKKLDKMAQDAIDAMSGSNQTYSNASSSKKSGSGSSLMTLVWILFIICGVYFAATS